MHWENDMFYSDAMKLFKDAGHTTASEPVFKNHSAKQVVYLDTNIVALVDPAELRTLESATCISHLFDLRDEYFKDENGSIIAYYSIVIECSKRGRSQTAHNIHAILHATFGAEISIIIFRHETSLMISIAGVNDELILSDWFECIDGADYLIDKIHICQLSMNSAYEFITDLIYLIARGYYLAPTLDGVAVYSLLPINYFSNGLFEDDFMEQGMQIKDLINQFMLEGLVEYGDDYVEPMHEKIRDISKVDEELNMLSFELDVEEEIQASVDVTEIEENEEPDERDEYEFEDVDDEIFKDPELMLKWLDSI